MQALSSRLGFQQLSLLYILLCLIGPLQDHAIQYDLLF